ncbi:LysM peptidoglycan-binding domain-containing protein [Ornithinibacillus xuwenensis]|uniref:LysM peptidoglycan-binding domain-containing protein n=1 Tax=Ornithinibacillus xuwenensis TaxID=3144668 RepID=A0ABU9XC52_9BACI
MAKRIDDAGHGGADPGAQANGIKEKVYTLEAAKYVNARLKELGIDSNMTRTSDVTLDQKDRTSKTSRYAKGISHHYNAGGGAGAEFIYSIYADGKFEDILIDEFKKAGYPVRCKFQRRYPNKSNWDYYYMHRETGKCRVTIVEYDFVDGPNAYKLKRKSYREGMYECVIKAICHEENVKYVAPGKKVDKPSNDVHVVRTGDTLWGIAKDNDTTVAVLKQLNGLEGELIHPGDQIKLPSSNPLKKEYYTIEKGDTLWYLENKFKLDHGDLQKLNRDLRPKYLRIGQRIRIK